MTILVLVWAAIASLWAIATTIMLVHNPLPFPDRGHRAYDVPSEKARQTILKILREIGGLREHFTFDAGPTRQTLMWDGYTILNHIDQDKSSVGRLPANAISLPVKDPRSAAEKTLDLLTTSGYRATINEITDATIPPNRLVVIESDAFKEWVLVLRRHVLKMPRIERRKSTNERR